MSLSGTVACLIALLPAGPPDFRPAALLLQNAVADGAFPGCAVAVGTSQEVLWRAAFGSFDDEGGPPASTDSLYDLASLTKVVGTTSVVLTLVRDGRLCLTDPVARYIPEFSGEGREGVTVEHLLTHSSGLPAWKPIYRDTRGYDAILREVIKCPLEREPGTRETYSDLGFILLGEVAARAAGCSLPTIERGAILEPLHLGDTLRNPPEELWERVVPTEKRPLWEGGEAPLVATRGIVHDENAAAGDGVTGQAGLFSTADDLAAFAAELLRGYRGASALFPEDVVREFVARRNLVPGSTRALGWDTPARGSSAGDLLSPRSFGHTGFTGSSLWIDPDRDLYILLLSNRVYPSRENTKVLRVRRELADIVVSCADGAPERS